MKNNEHGSLKIISYYIGYIIIIIGLLMLIPIATALVFAEFEPLVDFFISMFITLIVGCLMVIYGYESKINNETLQWKHGFVISAFSWIILMVLSAIPYQLSGHMGSFLDACFDVMSGYTTTGLILIQDLDHISVALNMWRHLITFVGGQGMVVLALSFLASGSIGLNKMYVGEGKDIGLVPNMKGTARIIWKISIAYLIIGTLVLWILGMIEGLRPVSSFLHGLFIFESAWSTGGFTPNSQSMMYYHSFSMEAFSVVIFIIGSLNFGLHYAVIKGNKKELYKNIETQSFITTATLASFFAARALTGLYPDALSMFRRGIYNILSAHTTTGFASIYAVQFAKEWGGFAILIMVIAMLIGGSACSTAGGFKGLRVGVIFKSLVSDVKKLVVSERSKRKYKYHHIKDYNLEDGAVKSAYSIVILYIIIFFIGVMIATSYGYSIQDSLFETASVVGDVGLTIGVTSPSMPTLLKVYYIFGMYAGRLEFLSIFAMIAYFGSGVRKLWKKSINHQ